MPNTDPQKRPPTRMGFWHSVFGLLPEEGSLGKIGKIVTITIALFGVLAGSVTWAHDAYVSYHDHRYMMRTEFAEAQAVLIHEVREQRLEDELIALDSDIAFYEAAIQLKRVQKTDYTLEELSLKKAERRKEALHDELKKIQ